MAPDHRAGEHQVAADLHAGQQDTPFGGEDRPRAVPAHEQAPVDGHTREVERIDGRGAEQRAGQVEVAGDPRPRHADLAVGDQAARVAGAADDEPVGDHRPPAGAVELRRRQPQRPADPGVGQVHRAVRGEPVVEGEIGGDAHVARPQGWQPAAGQREPGELGHPQVGRLVERAGPQVDGDLDPGPGQPQHAGDPAVAQPQRGGPGGARRGGPGGARRGEDGDERGGRHLGAAEIELVAPRQGVGQHRHRILRHARPPRCATPLVSRIRRAGPRGNAPGEDYGSRS